MRDCASGVEAYIHRLNRLSYPREALRFVVCEGDSIDLTRSMLRDWEWSDRRAKLVTCDTGKPKYGSVEHPERFEILAQVFNAALDAVDYDWSDCVLFLPVDIIFDVDLLERLLRHDVAVVAPLVFSLTSKRFYDVWAFTRNGYPLPPVPYQVLQSIQASTSAEDMLLRMDTVGGTVLIDAQVLRDGVRYSPVDVDRGLCRSAKEKSYRIYADPGTVVFHP